MVQLHLYPGPPNPSRGQAGIAAPKKPTSTSPDSGVTLKSALPGMGEAFKSQATAGSETPHLTVFLGPVAKEESLGGRILGTRRSQAR